MTQALSDPLPQTLPHADQPAIKQGSWLLLLAVLALDAALSIYTNFVLFRSPASPLLRLEKASQGLLSATWTANLLSFAIIVGLVMMGIGRLRPRDIGLDWRRLPLGIAVTLGTWAAMQLFALLALLDPHTTRTASLWTQEGTYRVIGRLLGQLGGNAVYEEVVFRGFLLPQIYLLLLRRWPQHVRRSALLALLLSQSVFALSHIPNYLTNTIPLPNILDPFVGGLLFAAIYLGTGNLFIAMGMHALSNYSPLWVETSADTWLVRYAIMYMLIIPWQSFTRFRSIPAGTVDLSEEGD